MTSLVEVHFSFLLYGATIIQGPTKEVLFPYRYGLGKHIFEHCVIGVIEIHLGRHVQLWR